MKTTPHLPIMLAISVAFGLALAGCNLDTWHYFVDFPCGRPVLTEGTNAQIEPDGSMSTRKDPEVITEVDPGARTLVFQIKADFPDGEITPDELLVDGKVPERGELWPSGPYSLLVRKRGYETLEGTFEIPKGGFGDYMVVRMMVCKERKLVLQVTDKATGAKLDPDQVLIGARQVKDGDMIKPCETTLEIKKKGYQSVVEAPYTIEVGEGSFFVKKEMLGGKVELRFEFTDVATKSPIDADTIALNDKATADGSYVEPGPYQLLVTKQGYKNLKKRVDVPQTQVHIIREALDPSTIRLYWEVRPDIFRDLLGELDPVDQVLLDGREVQEGCNVSSGKHSIEFRQAGYKPLLDSINIPAEKDRYVYKGEMTSLPRLVALNVLYDIPPPRGKSYSFAMVNLQTKERYTQGGEKVKPGTYEITVTQNAYYSEPFEKKILPASYAEEIQVTLQAKERVVQANITFDMEPPAGSDPHTISFVDLGGKYSRVVRPGGRIKPGIYDYEVVKPGYLMEGGKKRANIEPGEEEYRIVARLVSQPRQISFKIVDDTGRMVQPTEIKIDGDIYSFAKFYRPKQEPYRVEATFGNYRTAQKEFILVPGIGPYEVSLEVKK